MPRATLTRRECISSCHRLHNPKLSEQENKSIFGKCNNPNGHGHNYVLEVHVTGNIDPVTGMVVNLTDLKAAIQVAASEPLDHRNIDLDVPYFRDNQIVSTTENLAVFIHSGIKRFFGNYDDDLEVEVRLWETEKNSVIYRG